MSIITIYDELSSFSVELVELLKEDWQKFKLFIKKNKNYCLWILILFITLQFTDLLNLGASWNSYCRKNEGKTNHTHMQIGGDGGPAAPAADGKPDKATAKEAKKEKKQAKKDARLQRKDDKKAAKDQRKADKAAAGPAPSAGAGLDKVFSMVSGMFVIISFILVVVGIISIPIIVFIVITYTILKYMVSKVSVL